jgi:adenylate cyclase
MAFWNAPLDVADHEVKAVRAALGMRDALAGLNANDAFGFGPQQVVKIGIGIHTGLACVGNMGAESRFNYSAVGDAVNMASRIESSCKTVAFDILISERTASSLPNYALLEAGALELKGKSGRTPVYAVVGDDRVRQSPEFVELIEWHTKFVQSLQAHGANIRNLEHADVQKVWHTWPSLQEFYIAILERQKHFWREPQAVLLPVGETQLT